MFVYLVADDYEYPHLVCATLELAMKLEEERRPLPLVKTRWVANDSYDGHESWERQSFTFSQEAKTPSWVGLGVTIEQHEIRES